jgi:multicomponent Na+:H+ antiporter subunit D
MPWTMAAFSIGALSMIGLPPTAGFVSKWYIVSGSLQAGSDIAVAAIVISTVLNAAYFLPILYRAWFLPYDPDDPVMRGEAPLPVVLAVTASAMLTLAFFFYHEPAVLLAENLVASGP